MKSVTVRNIPDNIHRALKVRAAKHGRSTEAEIREILENSVFPDDSDEKTFSELAADFRAKTGGVELNIKRDKSPARAADFE